MSSALSMMFCSECGKEHSKSATSCPNCGKPVVNNQVSTKSNTTALLLCLFLGTFGAHRFYVGKTGSAVAMLIISCTFFGLAITSIWAIIDLVMIITKKFNDATNKPLNLS